MLHGDPAQQAVWSSLDDLLKEEFRAEDGRVLRVRGACIDTGGHHAERVYAFCRTRQMRRVYAVKGMAGARPIWPKRASRSKTNNIVFSVGVDTAKDAIYGRLRIAGPGPGYVHFPADDAFDDQYFAQLTAERVVTRYRQGRPYRVWEVTKGVRNEALYTFVYALAALKSLPIRLDRKAPVTTKPDLPQEDDGAPPPIGAPPPVVVAAQVRTKIGRRVARSNYMR